jgi:DHA1 family solute carrier family 18 vesicular amine transporter 1/2
MHLLEAARGSRKVVVLLATLVLFADLLTYDMIVPFLPDCVRKWEISQVVLSVLFGAYPVAFLLALPLVGWFCDGKGPRFCVLLGAFGLVCSTLLCAWSDSFTVMLAARILQGLAGAASWTGCLALLASVFPQAARGRAMGTAMAGMSLGTLVGPTLGGVLFEWGGYRLPFFCAGCLALFVGSALVLVLPHSSRQKRRSRVLFATWTNRTCLEMTGAIVLGAALLSMLEPILPLHLAQRLHAGPADIGFLFGLATLVYAVSAPLAGAISDRWGRRRTMTVGLVVSALALPLASLPASWWGEAFALVPLGLGCAFLLSPTLPELAEVADLQGEAAYGAAYALSNTAYAVGMMLGPLVGGVLTARVGVTFTFVTSGLVALLYTPFLLLRDGPHATQAQTDRSLAA